MRLKAQQLFNPEEISKVVSLTVDDALTMALASVEDNSLDEAVYMALLDKLGDLEQNAFTMGLATEGIVVRSKRIGNVRRTSSAVDKVIANLTALVERQGCVYEDQYRDALYEYDGTTIAAVNNWIMGNMIPLKRNPPRGLSKEKGVTPEYKKKVLRQIKHPNVKKVSSLSKQYRAKLGYSKEEGGYYARVVEAKSGASVAESTEVYADRRAALHVAARLLAGLTRQGQEQQSTHQQYMTNLDDLVTRLQTATDEADKSMTESPGLSQAKDEVKRAIEKFRNELSKMAKRQAAVDAEFLAEKRMLLKEINDYRPQNVKDWQQKVNNAESPAALRKVWDAFYQLKNEIPSAGEEPRTTHTFTEFVGLPQAEDDEPIDLA